MFLLRLAAALLLSACLCLTACASESVLRASVPTATEPTSALPSLTLPGPSNTPLPTRSIALSFPATPTLTGVVQGPGTIECPILLYHHVSVPPPGDTAQAAIYYVTPADFELQMQALQSWGYHTISVSLLAEAILHSAVLPSHPIVITFDDGNQDVFTNGFPIMQKYGFTGVMYVIVGNLQTAGYINPDQLKTLVAAGWEVGDHSLSHRDLRQEHDRLEIELGQSRQTLQKAIGAPVDSFSYPFGGEDSIVINHVRANGYTSAVGLGGGWQQGKANLYYLSRRPVLLGDTVAKLASYLPWSGAPVLLNGSTSPATP